MALRKLVSVQIAFIAAMIGMANLPTASMAATATTTMAVSSVTVAACIVAATPLVFGTINLIGASPNDNTSLVTVTCTPGTAYNVGLDNGANFGTTRRMKSATAAVYVPYNLYSDTLRATPWGNTVGTNTVSGTAAVTPTVLTVYGRVPGGTTPVPTDTYLDLVTVTITY
ncbi:Csu type fimbrial protein [Glacieibacterium megasporae]|uniref:Csu type fimbrial protein n=1 Tax=Glacieibacterium megasporae TaxID=2835787 RepID=UPI001C1E156E|nr:spore coat U domain-containing protein [Polymorphobacter megasporae]UAJ10467.1 spore coat U domain-containing protein [Polymorphobacter megasporae]